jgi:hypothetical protein
MLDHLSGHRSLCTAATIVMLLATNFAVAQTSAPPTLPPSGGSSDAQASPPGGNVQNVPPAAPAPATPVPPAAVAPSAPTPPVFPGGQAQGPVAAPFPQNAFPQQPPAAVPGTMPTFPAMPGTMPAPATPPPSSVVLIAPLIGQWAGQGTDQGVATNNWLQLNVDGSVLAYAQYPQLGLTVQMWGTYRVAATTPQSGFLSVQLQGWQPQQFCGSAGCVPVQLQPQANLQFSLADANTLLAQAGVMQVSLRRVGAAQQPAMQAPSAMAPQPFPSSPRMVPSK